MLDYQYFGTAQLNDGTEVRLDLEAKGWADKQLLAKTVRFSIVPKDNGALGMGGAKLPIVVVNIPQGGRPVFKTRVFGVVGANDGVGVPMFRCYGIGYKLGRKTHWTWVLPTGDVEMGDDPWLADILLRQMKGLDA